MVMIKIMHLGEEEGEREREEGMGREGGGGRIR